VLLVCGKEGRSQGAWSPSSPPIDTKF